MLFGLRKRRVFNTDVAAANNVLLKSVTKQNTKYETLKIYFRYFQVNMCSPAEDKITIGRGSGSTLKYLGKKSI